MIAKINVKDEKRFSLHIVMNDFIANSALVLSHMDAASSLFIAMTIKVDPLLLREHTSSAGVHFDTSVVEVKNYNKLNYHTNICSRS